MKTKLALAALAVTLSSLLPSARADEPLTRFTEAFTPTAVFAGYADGSIFIRGPNNLIPANSGCARRTSTNIITIKRDAEKVMSLALSAFLSGAKLSCVVPTAAGESAACGDSVYITAAQCIMTR